MFTCSLVGLFVARERRHCLCLTSCPYQVECFFPESSISVEFVRVPPHIEEYVWCKNYSLKYLNCCKFFPFHVVWALDALCSILLLFFQCFMSYFCGLLLCCFAGLSWHEPWVLIIFHVVVACVFCASLFVFSAPARCPMSVHIENVSLVIVLRACIYTGTFTSVIIVKPRAYCSF